MKWLSPCWCHLEPTLSFSELPVWQSTLPHVACRPACEPLWHWVCSSHGNHLVSSVHGSWWQMAACSGSEVMQASLWTGERPVPGKSISAEVHFIDTYSLYAESDHSACTVACEFQENPASQIWTVQKQHRKTQLHLYRLLRMFCAPREWTTKGRLEEDCCWMVSLPFQSHTPTFDRFFYFFSWARPSAFVIWLAALLDFHFTPLPFLCVNG